MTLSELAPAGVGLALAAVGEISQIPGVEYLTVPGILLVVLWFVGTIMREYFKAIAARESTSQQQAMEAEKTREEASRDRERMWMQRQSALEDTLVKLTADTAETISGVRVMVAEATSANMEMHRSITDQVRSWKEVIDSWQKTLPCLAMRTAEGRTFLQNTLDVRRAKDGQRTDVQSGGCGLGGSEGNCHPDC